MRNQILLGDCLDVLRTLQDSSVDSVVTDPPYGLGTREPAGDEIIQYLQGGDLDHGNDFMGREWSIPSVAVWRECLRVLMPGGHLLCFGGTRTFDLISIGIRAAGFECRDTIAQQFGVQVLQWVQGQGFPKALSVQKALEKAGLSAEEAAQWSGWATALKPSWEPVLVFRKPLAASTVAKQVLATRTGAMNIDGCRVRGVPRTTHAEGNIGGSRSTASVYGESTAGFRSGHASGTPMGRWPANVLLTHFDTCQKIGTKRVPAPVINRFNDGMKPFGDGAGHQYTSEQTGDADGLEEIPVYECAEGCPVKVLDEQSGELKSGTGAVKNRTSTGHQGPAYGKDNRPAGTPMVSYPDVGGASRFFPQFEPDAPFFYSAKVSKAERDRGLPRGTNLHPTVKPQALMRWMVRLVTPKDGTVIDPYCGSGSTLVAAVNEGFDYIGIERDPEFHRVAELRLKAALEARANIMDELAALDS